MLLWTPQAAGQATPARSPNRKQATATHVENGTILVDGRLTEEAWLRATPITDFIQKEPTQGAAPTDDMEVRFVYDERALYVGARMYSRNSRAIRAPLGPRDTLDQGR